MRPWRAALGGLVAVTLLGCGEPASDAEPRLGPLTPTDPARISAEQHAAIAALAAASSPDAPDPHAGHHGHDEGGPATTIALDMAERDVFAEQWAAAAAASATLDTPAEATAAGYARSAVQGAGVGVHWVNWTLIDAPFDPAHPAMLLFDERDGRADLAGFSYWLRADPTPEGFAGPNDVWHQHTNLCVVNGWVDREMSASPAACAGSYLAGADLWMLHAWVVPGRPNRWGDFAVLDPSLCPPAAGTPDVARCPTT